MYAFECVYEIVLGGGGCGYVRRRERQEVTGRDEEDDALRRIVEGLARNGGVASLTLQPCGDQPRR